MDIAFLISAFRANQYPPPDRPEIAFAGKSNVGKSSLINVLVNRKGLAITSSRPGRTQSIN
ncbi:MAG: 50S ribosome-binding GTPase, partial [Deltaproteobacteria bacterium]|nr:50S ribosome-binding GTPase [Deltaproteobacteria bacterium]